jgi:hypothetical protein
MAGERLPARFALRNQVRPRWKKKCFGIVTNHMKSLYFILKNETQ